MALRIVRRVTLEWIPSVCGEELVYIDYISALSLG